MGCIQAQPQNQIQRDRQAFLQRLNSTFYVTVPALLKHSPHTIKEDKHCVLAAVTEEGNALVYAADSLKADKDVVLAAVGSRGTSLRHAADALKADKEVALAAVRQWGDSLRHVKKDAPMWKENKFVSSMVQLNVHALALATDDLRADKDLYAAAFKQMGHTVENYAWDMENYARDVLQAVTKDGMLLGFATDLLRDHKTLVKAAVTQNGNALQYASNQLREDREIVKAAVMQTGIALKFAKGGLNQDAEMLKASGLWDDQETAMYMQSEKAILSVKFSLAEQSTPYATEFALAMRHDPYLCQFKTYNPNAWCKKSCDPNLTDIQQQCRGTLDTCLIPERENLTDDKRPTHSSCWRVAFRFHQEECKATGGFMIQVQEREGLGAGQKIEKEMAEQVHLKVFRTTTRFDSFYDRTFHRVADAVKNWYEQDCANMDMEIVNLA